jgi:hypothetical protein
MGAHDEEGMMAPKKGKPDKKQQPTGKASKTNASIKGKSDPRPKSELHVTSYIKPNGHVGTKRVLVPINRD